MLPLLIPVIVIVAMIRLVDSMRIFDLVNVMTGGGPVSATLVASQNDYSIFQSGNFGQAAALGFVVLLLINIFVVIFLRFIALHERRASRPTAA